MTKNLWEQQLLANTAPRDAAGCHRQRGDRDSTQKQSFLLVETWLISSDICRKNPTRLTVNC
jgi:hypothetical protein